MLAENEANNSLNHEYMPFDKNKNTLKSVERKMGQWMLEQSVRSDTEVRNAIGKAILKETFNELPGALGTT